MHLLDPVEGHTNYFEKGVAVEFSVQMSRSMTNHPMEPTNFPLSMEAWRLVHEVFVDVFDRAKAIRKHCGSLGNVTLEDLVALFPDPAADGFRKLVATCVPR